MKSSKMGNKWGELGKLLLKSEITTESNPFESYPCAALKISAEVFRLKIAWHERQHEREHGHSHEHGHTYEHGHGHGHGHRVGLNMDEDLVTDVYTDMTRLWTCTRWYGQLEQICNTVSDCTSRLSCSLPHSIPPPPISGPFFIFMDGSWAIWEPLLVFIFFIFYNFQKISLIVSITEIFCVVNAESNQIYAANINIFWSITTNYRWNIIVLWQEGSVLLVTSVRS